MPKYSNHYTVSETEVNLIRFDTFTATERLEAVLVNPDDHCLLCDLSWRHGNHKKPGLSAIFAFAMTKGGAMAQNWRAGEPWQRMTVEDHPDGFFPHQAYWCLQFQLPKEEDKKLLRDLRRVYENFGYHETASWAIWQFAMTKGRESSREWRLHRNAARARESMGEILRGRSERLRRQWRLRWNIIRSRLRHRLRSLPFRSPTSRIQHPHPSHTLKSLDLPDSITCTKMTSPPPARTSSISDQQEPQAPTNPEIPHCALCAGEMRTTCQACGL